MNKSEKGVQRRRYLAGIYKLVFGEKTNEKSREIARLLIEKLNIPYTPGPLKMEVFVSKWIRENRNDVVLSYCKKSLPSTPRNPQIRKTSAVKKLNSQASNTQITPNLALKTEFYESWDWRTLRMQALKIHGPTCQCCGASRGNLAMSGKKVVICVDHIEPISKRWDLRLSLNNLQILCDECNMGKGNWDNTDWRQPSSLGTTSADSTK